MNSLFKRLAAGGVTRFRPSLLRYMADAQSRRDITVTVTGGHVDIVRRSSGQALRIARRNSIYIADMITSFDFFFHSAEPITVRESGRLLQLVDFSTPRLHYVAGFQDFAVLCPSLTEPYLTTAQYLDHAALGSGGVVIDLGAYSALTSIAFSKAVGPTGLVIAVEPDPLNHRTAEVNIARHRDVNGLANIRLVAAAVSDKAGELQLSSEGAMGSALTSIVGGYRGETVDVEAMTLTTLAERCDLKRVDFIKMDIEGAELNVVSGNREFLARYRPRMVIEAHSLGGALTSTPIISILEALGYRCEQIEQQGMCLPLMVAHPGD